MITPSSNCSRDTNKAQQHSHIVSIFSLLLSLYQLPSKLFLDHNSIKRSNESFYFQDIKSTKKQIDCLSLFIQSSEKFRGIRRYRGEANAAVITVTQSQESEGRIKCDFQSKECDYRSKPKSWHITNQSIISMSKHRWIHFIQAL